MDTFAIKIAQCYTIKQEDIIALEQKQAAESVSYLREYINICCGSNHEESYLLMIHGPIEFEPAVLAEMGAPTTSHLAANINEAFSQTLERMRQVFLCPEGKPLVLSGTGTLSMDSAGANVIEPGDRALVVNSGYFSDRFGAILERYGAKVNHVRADPGGCPSLQHVENALSGGQYKLVTVTHVDTSTGVLTDIQGIAKLARQYKSLCVVDGVCSVAGEELRMTDWGVDLVLTASQKAVGVPPGLALLMVGERALAAFHSRKTSVINFYADWTKWLPIMQAYEARKPSYFATPSVNMIFALKVANAGVTLAGGLHPSIRTEYVRIGHMGSATVGDILATLGAVEAALAACSYPFTHGASVAAASSSNL